MNIPDIKKHILNFKKNLTLWIQRQSVLSVFCIALALIYCIAFMTYLTQYAPLIGNDGLLPAAQFIESLKKSKYFFLGNPTLFWVHCSTFGLGLVGWIGLILSLVCLTGRQNAFVWLLIWACYLSIVHVGQVFYGYGWEFIIRNRFFTCFLCPVKGFYQPKETGKQTSLVTLLYGFYLEICLAQD